MIEKPAISDASILACLVDEYGMDVHSLDFLPLGNDAAAWVYRGTEANGANCFLKIKKGEVPEASVAVPRFLRDQGIRQVVAPIPNQTNGLWTPLGEFNLILYPFVDGEIAATKGMAAEKWADFGRLLHAIHATKLPPELAGLLPKEEFGTKWWGNWVRNLQLIAAENSFDNPHQVELAAFLRQKQAEIRWIVERAEALGRQLLRKELDFVLCHSDIHLYNVLLDQANEIHIVDWDAPIFAPRERDLMFVGNGTAAGMLTREEIWFYHGYGRVEIDPAALAYYRYEWVLQDIGDYGNRVLLMEGVGDETRAQAVSGLVEMFAPGDVVDAAYTAETFLPPDQRCRLPDAV